MSLRASGLRSLLNAIWNDADDARPICRAPSVESTV
jgi:hypothetical protein